MTLKLAIQNLKKKHFIINDKFSFNVLKEYIISENPNAEVDFDFSKSNLQNFDDDTLIFEFLYNQTKGEVLISIDDEVHILQNMKYAQLNEVLEEAVDKAMKNDKNVFYWYKKCIENGIQTSHTGTLAYFLKNFATHLSQFKKGSSLSETEIENIIKESLKTGLEPVTKKIEQNLERINQINYQLLNFAEKKQEIETDAEKKIKLYQYLILLLSVTQFLSFYYMIFHVDWLGNSFTK